MAFAFRKRFKAAALSVRAGRLDRVYEPTGKDLVLNVSDAVRIDSDGMITDRWSGLSFAHLHWELEQNDTL